MSHRHATSLNLTPYPAIHALPRTVLVAFEDQLERDQIGWELRKGGYNVVEVEDGLELMDYLEEAVAPQPSTSIPDAIVAAQDLPCFSGTDVCETLREFRFEMPFVLVVGSEQEQNAPEVMRAGVNHVCIEPLESDAVRNVLTHLFDRRMR
jgi:CheY-like chemotaxis protein